MRCVPRAAAAFARTAAILITGLSALGAAAALAGDKRYAPGITDTEIKIGQTMPHSGAAPAWGADGLAEIAHFNKLNDRGGVNGRKNRLSSLDDAASPPNTAEQT